MPNNMNDVIKKRCLCLDFSCQRKAINVNHENFKDASASFFMLNKN
jgi:hypothetical protein